MSTSDVGFKPQELIEERLRDHAGTLMRCLQEQDVAGAFAAIEHINAAKEESIYHGLGLLARGLHTAIVTFQVEDHGKAYLAHDDQGAAPVTSQLDNVIRMGEESVRKTLNILDGSMPLIKDLRSNLEHMTTDGADNAARLAVQKDGLAMLEGNLMEILMAQGFQDLTGQAIRKVNRILDSLEQDLVSLLTFANQVKSMSEPVPMDASAADEVQGDAPAEVEAESKDAAMSQDSVDDLLSSLGF